MATHTSTANLSAYKPATYPNIDGGEKRFITQELQKISVAISNIVVACKAMEARMNADGLA